MPEVELESEISLETFLRMVQLPFDVSNVNATQEFLDSHKAWQASTFVYFLDVLTLEILPLNMMFSFVSNFMSAASVETAKNTMLNAVTLIK
jgi:hypothetical protein